MKKYILPPDITEPKADVEMPPKPTDRLRPQAPNLYDSSGHPSIDNMIAANIQNLARMTKIITQSLSGGTIDREIVQNLKDVMGMLQALKKEEREYLNSLSDERLEELAADDNKK